jgi:hypothetical protein
MTTKRRIMWGLVVMALNAFLIFGVKQWIDDDKAEGAPVTTAAVSGDPSSGDVWCFAYSTGLGFWAPWAGAAAGAYCLFMPDNAPPITPSYRCFQKAPHDAGGGVLIQQIGTPSTVYAGKCPKRHTVMTLWGQRYKVALPSWGVQLNNPPFTKWVKFS